MAAGSREAATQPAAKKAAASELLNHEYESTGEKKDPLDLDGMAARVIELCNQEKSQEALEEAVKFSLEAVQVHGQAHPAYINSLATVAAIMDKMGGRKEAEELLHQAEELQEEMERKAVEEAIREDQEERMRRRLAEPVRSPFDADDDSEEEYEMEDAHCVEGSGLATPPENLLLQGEEKQGLLALADAVMTTTGHPNNGTGMGESGGAKERPSEDVDGETRDEENEHAEGGGSSDDESDEESSSSSGEDEEEAAAMTKEEDEELEMYKSQVETELVTRLTWEVNTLIKLGKHKEAAKILSKGEKSMVKRGISNVTEAALHTLWATLLDQVGEGEKAETLYQEALDILEVEVNQMKGPDDEAEDDEGNESAYTEGEGTEEEEGDGEDDEGGSGEGSTATPPMSANELEEVGLTDDVATAPSAPGTADRLRPESAGLDSLNGTSKPPCLGLAPSPPPDGSAAVDPARSTTPTKPPTPKPTSNGRPAGVGGRLLPQPEEEKDAVADPPTATAEAATEDPLPQAQAKATARVGGGFGGVAVSQPKRKVAAKPKRRPPPLSTDEAVALASDEDQPLALQEDELELEDRRHRQLKERKGKDMLKVMRNADHYLGMRRFRKAADLLESVLSDLEDDPANPQRHADLHVRIFEKYGDALKHCKDFEGAIDALNAADEILEDRLEDAIFEEGSESDTGIRRWRASVSKLMGDVFQTGGATDNALEAYEKAAEILEQLVVTVGEEVLTEADRQVRRESQAGLAQAWAAKGEWDRAEALFVEAYDSDGEIREARRAMRKAAKEAEQMVMLEAQATQQVDEAKEAEAEAEAAERKMKNTSFLL